ncbi:MBOAT family protein [Niameybacter massiliensis]|uniref:MBOAT family protein n=1 Tax=Holtiella tumoricola TaxID=3018743 RepID=A0AA42J1G3_9FIRM|nr:MBOAT family protein [Holtiella tumoricola]MDA3732183.1 MBOAT family protein [Holtiella tumoricola]
MLFSSIIFLFICLPCILLIYYGLCGTRKWKNYFLLCVSLGFYAWGEPKYIVLLLVCILGNYVFGRFAESLPKGSRKVQIMIVAMLVFNLGILGIFKYLGFAVATCNSVLQVDWNVPNVILPIGISFFTFQGISYVMDIYRGKGRALKNVLDVGLYIALFPQLIAGPIVRYETVAEELRERRENVEDFAEGVIRFAEGLGKKVILANNFALVADKAFGLPDGQLSVVFAWLGAISYMLQVYFDFSGYSDMAIGLGRMFGFHFCENFRGPYTAKTISEFWRRWHISLGSWFRDYVYIPLGGSRVAKKNRLICNLLIVWGLTGIWHGANWTFIVWGLYFGLLIMTEKVGGLEKKLTKLPFVGHIYTLLLVLIGWVFFRADSLIQAIQYLKVMFGFEQVTFLGSLANLYLQENFILLIIGAICCLPLKEWVDRYQLTEHTSLQVIYRVGLSIVTVIAVAYLVKGNYNPFIYFNF